MYTKLYYWNLPVILKPSRVAGLSNIRFFSSLENPALSSTDFSQLSRYGKKTSRSHCKAMTSHYAKRSLMIYYHIPSVFGPSHFYRAFEMVCVHENHARSCGHSWYQKTCPSTPQALLFRQWSSLQSAWELWTLIHSTPGQNRYKHACGVIQISIIV